MFLEKYTVTSGADPNSAHSSSGVTPLIAAVRWLGDTETEKFAQILDLLVQNGADLDRATKGGQTPLRVAVDGHKLSFFTLLVCHGSNVNLPDHRLLEIIGDLFLNFGPEFLQFLWLAGLKFHQGFFHCPGGDPDQSAVFIQTVLNCRNECLPLKAACRLRIRCFVQEGRGKREILKNLDSLPVSVSVKEYLKFYHM